MTLPAPAFALPMVQEAPGDTGSLEPPPDLIWHCAHQRKMKQRQTTLRKND